ncbi:DNA polymerase III subunit [Clostridium aminobutyricum]|uniref:DNA polymerase III subunit n=1 Tax=Clostridium aminobutyricum TaxID=33953 RepID=A0A939IHV8_CLOAM|nr:DNA polymerase III subunit [Clostridium aminobutyricum]MBN7774267.1 DNA polymerase III subunit [Clostridium aminobutyricum]
MILNDIGGNDKLIEKLRFLSESGNLSHAYILEGESSIDKLLVANCFAKAILCNTNKGNGCYECPDCRKIDHGNHEDVIYIEADGKSIKDEAVEELQTRLKKKPFFGDRNIAIIKEADTMTVRAQNRLLKTLEEPPAGTIIILLSDNIENLVQTILSRCVIFRLYPFETVEYKEIKQKAENLVELLRKNSPFYLLKGKINEVAAEKEEALKLLDAMELTYRDLAILETKESRIHKKTDIYKAVSLIEETRRDLQRGISTNYAMKSLILKIGG